MNEPTDGGRPRSTLDRIAPGLAMLKGYQRAWLRADLMAGLSVAAVALPTAIAYAQLAGFPPVVGLYASILPLVAYAVFGTSRQLIVNPDAATCAMKLSYVFSVTRNHRICSFWNADMLSQSFLKLAFFADVSA